MSYEFYKVLHVIGILLTLSGLIGLSTIRWLTPELPVKPKRFFFLMHGLGLVLLLVAGFGLAARLGMFAQFPLWLWAKITVWVILGGMIAFAKRAGHFGSMTQLLFIGLFALAAWLAVFKPF